MLIAGTVRPPNEGKRLENKQPKSFKQLERLNKSVIPNQHYDARTRGWGAGLKHIRLNTPHPPTTAELSKARSMDRKWRKAAAQYPGSPASLAVYTETHRF